MRSILIKIYQFQITEISRKVKKNNNREYYINYLPITLEQSGIQHMELIISQILKEQIEIKVKLLDQLDSLITISQKQNDCNLIILNQIFPIILNLIQQESFSIKQKASNKIKVIAVQLNEKDRDEYILTSKLVNTRNTFAGAWRDQLPEPAHCRQVVGLVGSYFRTDSLWLVHRVRVIIPGGK